MRKKRNLMINIADGLHYRMLHESGLLGNLQERYKIYLICYNDQLGNIIKKSYPNFDIVIYNIEKETAKVLNLILRLNILKSTYHFAVMNKKSRRNYSFVKHLLVSNLITSKLASLFSYFLYVYISYRTKKTHFEVETDAVLLSTPGQKIEDLFAYFQIKQSKDVPLFKCLIYSWDNLSAKGFLPLHIDEYFVWNRYMQSDLLTRHGVAENQIKIVGSPLAITYQRYAKLRKSDCRTLVPYINGKHNEKFIILISTIPPVYFGSCHRELIKYTKEVMSELTDAFLIIVRPHPFDYTDYNDLLCESICLDDNERAETKESWLPSVNSAQNLFNRLKSADLNVNIASTITLEALFAGTNVINWCVDYPGGNYKGSIEDYYAYDHYKEVVKFSNVVPVAKSHEDYKIILRDHFYNKDSSITESLRSQFIDHHFGPYESLLNFEL